MSSTDLYTQCELRDSPSGLGRVEVAWIPAKFAKVGKWLIIDGLPRSWRVVNTYASLNTAMIEQARSVWKRYRDVLEKP